MLLLVRTVLILYSYARSNPRFVAAAEPRWAACPIDLLRGCPKSDFFGGGGRQSCRQAGYMQSPISDKVFFVGDTATRM